jgi:hypothetical protein
MANFMVEISLPKVMDMEFRNVIPYQRSMINNLIKKGIIVNYSLSLDRGNLWVVVAARSLSEVKNIIGSFPIINFITFTVYELLFHEGSYNPVPHLWLN